MLEAAGLALRYVTREPKEMVMFECTFRGRTMKFETAQEMDSWMKRMSGPRTPTKQKNSKKPKARHGLGSFVKSNKK